MVFREEKQEEQPQQYEPQQQEQVRRFSNNGGGGPSGFFAFGGSSRSSSVVCRPDPTNPGHQICKKVSTESRIDPRTGQRFVTTNESEEKRELPRGGFFRGISAPSSNYTENEEPRWISRLKGIFSGDESASRSSPGSGFMNSPEEGMFENNKDKFGSYFKPQEPRGGFGHREQFDDFGMMNPFGIMREFDRMISEEFNQHRHDEGSFIDTSSNEEGFFREFFGLGGSPFDQRDDGFSHNAGFRNDFGGHIGSRFYDGHPNHYRGQNNSNFGSNNYHPNYNNNSGHNNFQAPPHQFESQPEPVHEPKIETAASKANAKVYDV